MADTKKIVNSIKAAPMRKATTPVVKETVKHFGQKMLDDADVDLTFNANTKVIRKYIKQFSGEKITGITKTTKARIRATLEQAIAAGKTDAQIAKILSKKFDRWIGGRAKVIAHNEVAQASNFASWEAMRQAEIERKQWLATNDERVRDTHAKLDGEVRDTDEPFSSGAMYPGGHGKPEEDIGCRCAVIAVFGKKALRITWRVFERQRKPYDTMMTRAVQRGFLAQKRAVLAALGA